MLYVIITASGMTPDVDYDRLSMAQQHLSSVAVLGLVCCAVWAASLSRMVTFTLAWMLIVVAPRFVVQTPMSYLNEHQFYSAVPGIMVGVASTLMGVESWVGMRRRCFGRFWW